MRITKKGKVVLGKNDVRTGNFVWSLEDEYIKVRSVAPVFSLRIGCSVVSGQMLAMAYEQAFRGEEGGRKYLEGVATVLFNVCCTVPDNDFLDALNNASVDCAKRHRGIYGLKDEVSDEEDARVIEEDKNLSSAEEELRKEYGDGCKD